MFDFERGKDESEWKVKCNGSGWRENKPQWYEFEWKNKKNQKKKE